MIFGVRVNWYITVAAGMLLGVSLAYSFPGTATMVIGGVLVVILVGLLVVQFILDRTLSVMALCMQCGVPVKDQCQVCERTLCADCHIYYGQHPVT